MLRQVYPPQKETADAMQCRLLARILTTTRDMVTFAAADDWEKVVELEKSRRADLSECFSGESSEQHAELTAEALAVMLHLNEELMVKLTDAREAVLQKGVSQVRTRTALDSYHEVKSHR